MKNGIFSNKSVNKLQTWRFMRNKCAVSFLEASQYFLLMQIFWPRVSLCCIHEHELFAKPLRSYQGMLEQC